MTKSNGTVQLSGHGTGGVAPLVWDDFRREEPTPLELERDTIIRPVASPMGRGDGKATPGPILVCGDCQDYHEFDDDWQVCPKCGEDLLEADPA